MLIGIVEGVLTGLLLAATVALSFSAVAAGRRTRQARYLFVALAFVAIAVRAIRTGFFLLVAPEDVTDIWWSTGGDAIVAWLLFLSMVR